MTTLDSSAGTGQPRRIEVWEALKRPTLLAVVVALICAILAGGGAAAAILKQAPRYQSVATLTIDQPLAIVSAGSEGVISKLNLLRAKYVALLYTSVFTAPVASELGLAEGEVARSINVGAPGPSLVLFIAARTRDPSTSKRIAQSLAAHLVTYIQAEQQRAFINPRDRILFSIVVPASQGAKVEPTKRRAATVGAVAAALFFGAVYIVVQSLSARRRRRLR